MEKLTIVEIAGLVHNVDVLVKSQATDENYAETFNIVQQIDG